MVGTPLGRWVLLVAPAEATAPPHRGCLTVTPPLLRVCAQSAPGAPPTRECRATRPHPCASPSPNAVPREPRVWAWQGHAQPVAKRRYAKHAGAIWRHLISCDPHRGPRDSEGTRPSREDAREAKNPVFILYFSKHDPPFPPYRGADAPHAFTHTPVFSGLNDPRGSGYAPRNPAIPVRLFVPYPMI